MRAFARSILLAGAAALLVASLGAAQTDTARAAPPRPGRILGVFDPQTNAPIEGADVTDLIGGGTARTARAGLIGMAAFQSQHDSSVVRIRKLGYADTTLLVMVGPADTVPMQVFLRRVVELPGVTVREQEHLPFYMRDFEERVRNRDVTGGKYFTPTELRQRDARRVYDLLRSKGIGVQTAHCRRIGLVRNGVPYHPLDVTPGSAGIPDEFVDDYEAFFYYPVGQVPAELLKPTIGGDCGVLVMYSRMR